jgi:hypothetical protein
VRCKAKKHETNTSTTCITTHLKDLHRRRNCWADSPFCSVGSSEFGTFDGFILVLNEGVVADGPKVVALYGFDDGSSMVREGHIGVSVVRIVGLYSAASVVEATPCVAVAGLDTATTGRHV